MNNPNDATQNDKAGKGRTLRPLLAPPVRLERTTRSLGNCCSIP